MIQSIYKYMPLRKAFFENFLLRVSGRDALNDPFEFFPSDSFLSDTVDNTFSQKELDDFVFSKYGIISFTETKDNLLMWSHYGDNHKGFVVEFNYNHNYFRSMFNNSSNDIEGNIYRVLYRKERFHGKSTEEDSAFLELFFHKSDEWEYEKEHRLLISFKHTNSAQELNLELPSDMFFIKIPEDAILSITFGCKADCSLIKSVRETLSKNINCKHIKIYKAKANTKDYKLDFDSI